MTTNKPNTDSVDWLRDNGYAVIIWTPEELAGAPVHKVEDACIESGWDAIDYFKEPQS